MLLAFVALLTQGSMAEEASEPKVKVISADELEKDVDLDEEVKVLSDKEKMSNLSAKVGKLFTEKFGEAWNAARECDMERS